MLQVNPHVVGLVALCAEFTCCRCTKLIHYLTYTRIPCRDSHCENGHVRRCLYSTRCNSEGSSSVFGIGPARRPGSPSPSEVAQEVGLIPVDSVGEEARKQIVKPLSHKRVITSGVRACAARKCARVCVR